MLSNYKIFVTIALRNMVARGLRNFTQQVRGAAGDVTRLQRQIETMQLLMRARLVPANVGQAQLQALNAQLLIANRRSAALTRNLQSAQRLVTIGTGMTTAGVGGLMLFNRMSKPGEDYMGRVNQLKLAGLTEVEINDTLATSWQTTSKVITSSVNENIRAILDLRNVMGRLDLAQMVLPSMQKAEEVFRASGMGEKSHDQAYDAIKVIDMLNKSTDVDAVERNLARMVRVAQVTGNRITPETFRMNLKYARQARGILDEDYIYGVMPTLALDLLGRGGGSGSHGGLGPMQAGFHKLFAQGVMGKGTATRLKMLGAFDQRAMIRDLKNNGALKAMGFKGPNLARVIGGTAGKDFAKNPYTLVHDWFLPLIAKRHGQVSDEKLKELINFYLAGAPQPTIDLVQQLATKKVQIERDMALYGTAPSMEQAYQDSLSGNPETARRALAAQWENVKVALTEKVLPHLLPLIIKTAENFNWLALKMREFPGLTEKVGLAFLGISGLLAVGGPFFLALGMFRLAFGQSVVSAIGSVLGSASAQTGLLGLGAVLGLPAWATLAVIAGGLAAIISAIKVWNMDPDARKKMADYYGGGDPLENADFSWWPKWLGGKGKKPSPDNGGTWGLPEWQTSPAIPLRAAGNGDLSLPTVPPRSTPPIITHTHFHADGQKLSSIVTRHQARAHDRPSSGGGSVDNRMGYPTSNLSQ